MVYTKIMKQLNSLFIVLFVFIGILSISYIWSSETDKEVLVEKSDNQAREIDSLKDQISKLEKDMKFDKKQLKTESLEILKMKKLAGLLKEGEYAKALLK